MTPTPKPHTAPAWHPEPVQSRLICCIEYLKEHGLLTPGLYRSLREDVFANRYTDKEAVK